MLAPAQTIDSVDIITQAPLNVINSRTIVITQPRVVNGALSPKTAALFFLYFDKRGLWAGL